MDLLDATIQVLAGLGRDEVLSLRAVARKAGVTPNAVYLQFTDRNELVAAAVELLFDELAAYRDQAEAEAVRSGGGLLAQLEARTLAYVRWALEKPGAYTVLYGGRAIPRLSKPESYSLGQTMLDRTVDIVRELEEQGLASPTVSPEYAGLLIWTASHGIVSLKIDKDTIDWPDSEELALAALRSVVRPV